METFIEQILVDSKGECNTLFDTSGAYRVSIQACMSDIPAFKNMILNHPKCPSWLNESAINDVVKCSARPEHNFVTGVTRSREWLFMYNIWMYLYH